MDISSQPVGAVAPAQASSPKDQLTQLNQKVATAQIPDGLKQVVSERVRRLSILIQSGNPSANYELDSVSTYVQWVIGLPWNQKSQDLLDLHKAKAILDKNHYGLVSIKDKIVEYLSVIILNLREKRVQQVAHAPIICLVGLAGTGKTTLAASIAESLARRFERIPFGGMGDSRVLRGQSRAFPDAEPGSVIKKLVHAQTKNSVILLDELDRVSQEARADIMGVLVELLDPEQRAYTDHYIDYPFDLSEVIFVATANNTTNISTAVLDRLEIIQMPSYTDAEKEVIAKSYIFPKIRLETGLTETMLVIDEGLWPAIIRPLGFDSGIRSLERTIQGICRKTARYIVEGKAQAIRITEQNVKEFIAV